MSSLEQLAARLGVEISGPVTDRGEVVVSDVTHDSRQVAVGSMFCCVTGGVHDGHLFAPDAVASGASALLCEHPIQGRTVTGLAAVYHAVEHFSFHTGQIVSTTKLLTGRDLSLYDPQGRRVAPLRGGSV